MHGMLGPQGNNVPEDEQSLITDELRAKIGVRSEPSTVTVLEEDARRMSATLGDTDPRWADGTGIAPPYIIAMVEGGRRNAHIPFVLPSGLLTQQEWRFERPFRIGEQLTTYTQLVDIRERLGGRYGHSVLVTTSTDYFDTEGQLVASALRTLTQFDPKRSQRDE